MQLFTKLLIIISLLANFQLHNIAGPSAGSYGGVMTQQVLANLCDKSGDWCSMQCQILGGRDGRCDKAKMCNCHPL
uniref:Invertebrate defensins family profile domain-containing protein n=1 Tax=Musca domestica TaxID=7370 RepID=A0A1I8NJH3_MUSDO